MNQTTPAKLSENEAELSLLLRASFPLICVVSHEEMRVEESTAKVCADENRKRAARGKPRRAVLRWSLTQGMVRVGKEERADSACDNPLKALKYIAEYTQPAVFILRDFFQFLGKSNYVVERTLRDLAQALTSTSRSCTIILVDTKLDLPERLEKLATVLDWSLPSREELDDTLRPKVENATSVAGKTPEEIDDLMSAGVESAVGLTRIEVLNVFAKSLVATQTLTPRVIVEEKKAIVRKSGVLEFYHVDYDLGAVGGLDNLKGWLRARGKAFSNDAREYGLPSPRGLLCVGVPGCGKSLISKAVGAEWGMPVLRMDVGALYGSYLGQSEAQLRKALKTAEAMSPCVLWVDEIEKSVGGGGGSLDGGTTSRVLGTLLSWLQENTSQVFFMATANDVSSLPPEMLRKGRFDELFFVDLPAEDIRRTIFEIHLSKRNRNPADFDVPHLAAMCQGFSGAEIEEAVVAAMFAAFSDDREFTTADIHSELVKTVPLSQTAGDKIQAIRTWAEGRAVPADITTSVYSQAPEEKAEDRFRAWD